MLENKYHYNKKLQEDYNLYGRDNFDFIIIEEIKNDNEEIFKDRERYWIKQLNAISSGYNISTGGYGEGLRPSKEKIKNLANINRKINKGKTLSNDTRNKMSKSNRHGAVLTYSDVYNIKLDLIHGKGINDLAREYNVSFSCISLINVNKTWKSVVVPGWEEYQKNRNI